FYLGLYVCISLSAGLTTFLRQLGMLQLSMLASQNLHDQMWKAVLLCPLSFFQSTPVGRVTARFARDVDTIDQTLSEQISQALTCFSTCAASIITIAVISPFFTVVVLPLTGMYYIVMQLYRCTSRELKRLHAMTGSPIYANFSETLMGLDTIRAYGKTHKFSSKNAELVDRSNVTYFPLKMLERWVSLRLEMLGNLITVAVCVLCVYQKEVTYAGLAGLVIYRSLSITSLLGYTVRSLIETENQLTAVERIFEYIQALPQEAARNKPADQQLPSKWPEKGEIVFDNLVLTYRSGLEPALDGVTATVRGGERIGVVGRTGAGKSTLMTALFRLVEPQEGRILIDGVDICTLGLHTLRSNMSIVPQDPVLFSGSVRVNLDPACLTPGPFDDKLTAALEQVGLKDDVRLGDEVAEYGSNFSAGQRQLMCMVRCILRNPRILVLDEATSSVDYTTDAMIQNTIRTVFAQCTVLTIAHRLNTISDSDRIMCFEAGKIGNFDTPLALLNQGSIYADLVNEMGPEAAQQIRLSAQGGASAPASLSHSAEEVETVES
ncbi:hypothetical protein CYMTET_23926, partial [Cymbomonas tetramitiformis]